MASLSISSSKSMKAAKTFCINKLKTNSSILLDHSASRSVVVAAAVVAAALVTVVVAAALVTVVVVVADVEVLLPFLLVMLQCF